MMSTSDSMAEEDDPNKDGKAHQYLNLGKCFFLSLFVMFFSGRLYFINHENRLYLLKYYLLN